MKAWFRRAAFTRSPGAAVVVEALWTAIAIKRYRELRTSPPTGAFARTVAAAEHGFRRPRNRTRRPHPVLLLEAAEAYDRELARTTGHTPDEVGRLLARLRDPAYTRVLHVTLPEATPVHEAATLADDLRRAGIEPHACAALELVNSSRRSGTRVPPGRRA